MEQLPFLRSGRMLRPCEVSSDCNRHHAGRASATAAQQHTEHRLHPTAFGSRQPPLEWAHALMRMSTPPLGSGEEVGPIAHRTIAATMISAATATPSRLCSWRRASGPGSRTLNVSHSHKAISRVTAAANRVPPMTSTTWDSSAHAGGPRRGGDGPALEVGWTVTTPCHGSA